MRVVGHKSAVLIINTEITGYAMAPKGTVLNGADCGKPDFRPGADGMLQKSAAGKNTGQRQHSEQAQHHKAAHQAKSRPVSTQQKHDDNTAHQRYQC